MIINRGLPPFSGDSPLFFDRSITWQVLINTFGVFVVNGYIAQDEFKFDNSRTTTFRLGEAVAFVFGAENSFELICVVGYGFNHFFVQ